MLLIFTDDDKNRSAVFRESQDSNVNMSRESKNIEEIKKQLVEWQCTNRTTAFE